MTVADYPDYGTPQAHATAISATGVPLLHAAAVLANQTGTNLPANATTFTGQLAFTQPSYEISVAVACNAASTVPFVQVIMQWTDINSGVVVEQDRFWIPAGNPGPAPLIVGRGPTLASALHVGLFNPDPTFAMTANLTVLESSRVFDKDIWHLDNEGYASNLVPGFTLPAFPGDNSCLGVLTGASIPASNSVSWLFAMASARPVNIAGAISGVSAGSVDILVKAEPVANYGSSAWLLRFTPPALEFNTPAIGTHGPVLVTLKNNATTGPATVDLAMFVQE